MIEIKQVTFKPLSEVAYGFNAIYSGTKEDVVTINYSIEDNKNKLEGHIEVSSEEFTKNASDLKTLVKNKMQEYIK